MDKKIGIYIHIPFCASKCAYCDFYSLAGKDKLMHEYHAAVLRHIKEYAPQLDGYLIDTVYFGGGTPSHYGAGRIISIFNAIKKHGHVLLDAEVTVEVNPGTITLDELYKLSRAGVNRLSIGVQSANDVILKNIGRQHTFETAEDTVKNARTAGFKNISIDLIYGLPSQSKDDWADTLARAAALKAEHVSCYGLKIEEGTPLYIFKDSPFLPDDDTQADMYLYAVETLARFGYKQYEVSNFARRGFESQHNLKYWFGEEYIGIGPSAHSYIGQCRYSYIADLEKYIERISSGITVIDQSEEMSDFEKAGEYLMLRLRTTRGISEAEYHDIYHLSLDLVLEQIRKFEAHGWMIFKDGRWRFTTQGFLLSNTLIGEILDAQTKQRTQTTKPWQAAFVAEEDPQLSLFKKKPVAAQVFNGE